MELTPAKKYFLLVVPILLTSSTALVFSAVAQWLGNHKGYLLGFGFYWVWCLSVPLLCWGKRGFRWVFTEEAPLFRKENWLLVSLLSLTIAGERMAAMVANIGLAENHEQRIIESKE